MTTSKQLFFIILFASFWVQVVAQEEVKPQKLKQKELGLVFSSFNNFGLTYRFGKQNALWRLSSLMVSGGSSKEHFNIQSPKSTRIGFSTAFGREYRKEIHDKIEIRYGADFSYGYSRSEQKSDYPGASVESRSIRHSAGINAVFGFNYLISDNLALGAEILPGITYSESENRYIEGFNSRTTIRSGFDYGLTNQSALLSMTIRF